MLIAKLKICLFVFRFSSFVKESLRRDFQNALEHWNIGTFLGYYKLLQCCNVAMLQHVFWIFAPL